MIDIGIEVIAGLIVASILGIVGLLVRQRRGGSVLPSSKREAPEGNYAHLNGDWRLYAVTRSCSHEQDLGWIRGTEHLEIQGNRIKGNTRIHSSTTGEIMNYKVHGEILNNGWMILTDICLEDQNDFASVIIPNLLPSKILVGIWTGTDGDLRLISAPVVLSRNLLDDDDLNEAIKRPMIYLAATAENYKSQELLI